LLIGILVAGTTVGFSVCASADDITVYTAASLTKLDPHYAETSSEHALVNALHFGLTTYDDGGVLGPGLAESWVISDNGRFYTFTLKSGLTWSNGRALKAEDVVAGFKRALNPTKRTPFAAKLFDIKNAEAFHDGLLEPDQVLGVGAPDPRTVTVSLEQRNVEFLSVLAHPVAMPAPANDLEAISDGRLSSGPFVVGTHSAGAVVLLARNGDTRLRFRVVDSIDQAWRESSQVDAFVTSSFPFIVAPNVGAQAADIQFDGGDALYAYVVNTAKAPLDTLEARHALAMAINRTEMLERVSVPRASVATRFVPPSAMTYEQPYRTPFAELTFEEREAVAAALLSEQGYGIENRFTVRLRVPAGDVHSDIAAVVSEMWARSGIDTEIITASMPDHWRALSEGDFDVAFATWPGRRDSPKNFLEPLSRTAGPWNWARYDFQGFNTYLARASGSEKLETQANQYREAEKALIEDQALLALFFYQPLALVSSEIRGWQKNRSGIHPLTGLTLSTSAKRKSKF